jgi:riboflavin biosynthesis pyrimidine reductase
MVGANTLRSEPEHLWTSDFIAPGDTQIFEKQRRADGRKAPPLQVFVTSSGEIFSDAAVFQHSELQVLIVTTEKAKSSIEALALPRTSLVVAGSDEVDFSAAMKVLYAEWGVRTLLCEGGPRLYGSLIKSGFLDEEFLTVSPLVIGSTKDAPRPGLVEGSSYLPGQSPRAVMVSVRRAGDHLFIRTKWQRPEG